MSLRIVFEVLTGIKEAAIWKKITETIINAGGTVLSQPQGDPPYLIRASLPNQARANEVIDTLKAMDGIGRVDIDAIRRTTFRQRSFEKPNCEKDAKTKRK